MSKKHAVTAALLSICVLVIVSCDLFPPQCALRLAGAPTIATAAGDNIEITFQLYNNGFENLQNCKVKWYVDTSDSGSVGTIESEEITNWAPSLGVDLSIGETSPTYTVTTTSGIYTTGTGGVVNYGVYSWGWENPPDE